MIETITLPLNADYICEDAVLVEKLTQIVTNNKYRMIQLVSPQNTGKSLFFKKIGESLDGKVSILTPTKLLALQQAEKYNSKHMQGRHSDFIGLDYSFDMTATYASAAQAETVENQILIVDEAHKIPSYANFAFQSMFETIEQIKRYHQNKGKVFLVTATPQPIEDMYGILPKIDLSIVIKLVQPRKYVDSLVYIPEDEFIQQATRLIIQNADKGKQIIILKGTSAVEKLTTKLNAIGISSVGIHSKNRTKEGILEVYNKIVNEGTFEAQVLVATSLIDCGISFFDEDIVSLFCEWDNVTMIKQFMGRARKCQPDAYIPFVKLNDFELHNLKRDRDLFVREIIETNKKVIANRIIPEEELENRPTIIRDQHGKLSPSKIATRYYVRNLHDRHILSDIESIKVEYEGYYNRLLSLDDGNDEIIEQCQDYLVSFIDRKLDKQMRDSIISDLNKLGLKGKQFRSLVERCGYRASETKNRKHYTITFDI